MKFVDLDDDALDALVEQAKSFAPPRTAPRTPPDIKPPTEGTEITCKNACMPIASTKVSGVLCGGIYWDNGKWYAASDQKEMVGSRLVSLPGISKIGGRTTMRIVAPDSIRLAAVLINHTGTLGGCGYRAKKERKV